MPGYHAERIMHLLSDSHVRVKLLNTIYTRMTAEIRTFLHETFSVNEDPTLIYSETLLIVSNSDLVDEVKLEIIKRLQLSSDVRIPKIGDPIELNMFLSMFQHAKERLRDEIGTTLGLEGMYINVSTFRGTSDHGWDAILYRAAAAAPAKVDVLTVDQTPAAGVMPFVFLNDNSFVSDVAHNMARYVQAGIISTANDPMTRQRIDIIQEILDFMYRFPGRGWRHKFQALYKELDIQGMAMYTRARHWSDPWYAEDRAALELRSIRGPRPSGGKGGNGNQVLRAQIEVLHYRRGIRRKKAIRPAGGQYNGPYGVMPASDKAWLRCTITPFGHFVRFLIEFWKQNSERIQDYAVIAAGGAIPPQIAQESQRFINQANTLDRIYNRFRNCFCADSKFIMYASVMDPTRSNHLFHYPKYPSPAPIVFQNGSRRGGYRPFTFENDNDPAPAVAPDDKICLLAFDSPDKGAADRWVQLTHGRSACRASPLDDDDPAHWDRGFGRYLQLMDTIIKYIHADESESPEGAANPEYRVTAKYHVVPNLMNHNIPELQTFVRGEWHDKGLAIPETLYLYRVSTVPEEPMHGDPTGTGEQDISTIVNRSHVPFFWRDAF